MDPFSIIAVTSTGLLGFFAKPIVKFVLDHIVSPLHRGKSEYRIITPSGAELGVDASEGLTDERVREILDSLTKASARTPAPR